ncbi:hypothetical protein HRQ91_02925 [Treponema parvum]|uniref:AAA domain-containing protein n=1 Tax=Treponema parvum TaxID=138851 RepID=A0A975F329_9SPIR|nr:hypothetical protein [Treponema parvum]QTQ13492.1 hypothetical protein HRQ91_02925 [Treponema parvum]
MKKLYEKEFPRIVRSEYLERLRNLRHKKLIKIITGGRRCGKSTILEMFRDELPSEGIKKRANYFHKSFAPAALTIFDNISL